MTLNLSPCTDMPDDEEQGLFAITLQDARLQAAMEDGIADVRSAELSLNLTSSPIVLWH